MTYTSRNIPAEVKRQVRRECYFGCVFCGMPVFEYEHIDDWALVKEHRAGNIVLLCPTHHAAKTTGKLNRDRIRQQRAAPFNKGRESTAGYKVEGDQHFTIILGEQNTAGNLSNDGSPYYVLWVNGKTMMSVRIVDDWISPSFTVTNQTGETVLRVEDGELQIATAVWDYTYEGSRITVRGALRDIMLEIDFSSDHLRVIRGQFFESKGDGFHIHQGCVQFYKNGIKYIDLSGSGTVGWGVGALAIVNTDKYPNLKLEGGYAMVCW